MPDSDLACAGKDDIATWSGLMFASLTTSERELAQICYENPGVSFYFLRLTTNRLIANASRIPGLTIAALQLSK
jgi:hypothetical protein